MQVSIVYALYVGPIEVPLLQFFTYIVVYCTATAFSPVKPIRPNTFAKFPIQEKIGCGLTTRLDKGFDLDFVGVRFLGLLFLSHVQNTVKAHVEGSKRSTYLGGSFSSRAVLIHDRGLALQVSYRVRIRYCGN